MTEKTCTKCGETKPVAMYPRNASSPCGYHPHCKSCRSKSRRALYAAAPEVQADSQRWRMLKHRFGLDRAAYLAKSALQDDLCAICGEVNGSGRRLSVDHDHSCCPSDKTCGACVRGLLCAKCNSLLGLANDNIDRLMAAAEYLRRWSPSQSAQTGMALV